MGEAEVFEIVVKGPGPFGFRLYGGEGDPLIVAKLRSRSKAHDAGLREGDIVLGINGRSCQTISHGIAMAILESADDALHLHLYRGSATKDSLSAAYQELGSLLRPVSPGTAPPNRSIFSIQPTPEAHPSAAPQPTPHQPPAEPASAPTTSFSRQQEVTSIGPNATQTITTETETQDLGGVTLTKVTKQVILESSGGGATWRPTHEPAKHDDDANVQRAAIFHVPKIQAQPLRWQPEGSSSASAWERGKAVDRIRVNIPVTVDVSPIVGAGGKEGEVPRVQAFARVEPPRDEQSRFKVPKTTAKPWVWQPSSVPSLPVREASPTLAFHALEASEAPPYENHLATKEAEPGRGGEALGGFEGGRSSDDPALSPDLIRVLTTEGPEEDWAAMMRRKKIFADSSFYDDPEQKYPTIEEQIKMARKVALSLSAPDNVTARGQRMFIQRKEKAKQWTSDNPPSFEGLVILPKRSSPSPRPRPKRTPTPEPRDLYYNPTPWKAPTTKRKVEKVSLDLRRQLIEGYPDEAQESFAKHRALFEQGIGRQESPGPAHYDRSGRKVHAGGSLAPRACHGLANDLKEMRGKGAKLFAQRRAKLAKEEAEEEEEQGRGWQSEGETGLVRGRSEERAGFDYPDPSDVAAVRRLEELISISKAYNTPWEAKAERQAVKEPWRPDTQGQPRKGVATEDHQILSARSTFEQKTIEGSQPSFLGNAPSGVYRPVRFNVHSDINVQSEIYSVPGPGVSEF